MTTAMFGELGVAIGCGIVVFGFLAAFVLALCRAAAGGDVEILRQYRECEPRVVRLERRGSHAREKVTR
jgi:hypothetical protein